MTADVLEATETADPYARIREALKFNPARTYTPAEARTLMLGPDAPPEQMPTENWLSRQLGLNNFESTKFGRATYLTGEQILKLIGDCAVEKYGLPARKTK